MLVVEQNARLALEFCDYAYVIESGRIVLEGPADAAARGPADPGALPRWRASHEAERSFATAKRYRRRRRWLA